MKIVHQKDHRSGITYAYESYSYWDKEKKQARKKRRMLGRVNPETGIIEPTDGRMARAGRAVYALNGFFPALHDGAKTAEAGAGAKNEVEARTEAEARDGSQARVQSEVGAGVRDEIGARAWTVAMEMADAESTSKYATLLKMIEERLDRLEKRIARMEEYLRSHCGYPDHWPEN
ncbi:MAG: hypothetical protein LBO66_04845 [Deltaproteobacteria bacterium]|jgi:hypothetical protein|nr:hypothetical protein [Deltaproteobacteria bacterium]